MGLDMYLYKVEKPSLENRVYTRSELEMMDCVVCVTGIDEYLIEEIIPYAEQVTVVNQYYDVEKIIADYNLPKNSIICMISMEGIAVSGNDDQGNYVRQEVSHEEIAERYTLIKEELCYVWQREEVAYWRKAFRVQELWHKILNRDIANCGYYEVNREDLAAFYAAVGSDEPQQIEYPDDWSRLFYHEWY